MIELSKFVDRYVPKERWIASLSNGETIYDDRRSWCVPAWQRLAEYCYSGGLSITGLRVQIAGTEIKLPSGMDGYIQKKKAWATIEESGIKLCFGYVTNGLSLIHEIDSSGDSRTIRPGDEEYKGDPGEPWTIYRKDIRDAKLSLLSA